MSRQLVTFHHTQNGCRDHKRRKRKRSENIRRAKHSMYKKDVTIYQVEQRIRLDLSQNQPKSTMSKMQNQPSRTPVPWGRQPQRLLSNSKPCKAGLEVIKQVHQHRWLVQKKDVVVTKPLG